MKNSMLDVHNIPVATMEISRQENLSPEQLEHVVKRAGARSNRAMTKASTPSGESGSKAKAESESVETSSTPGKIEGRGTVDVSGAENMHARFVEDDGFVTLVDACVAHLNKIPVAPSGADGKFMPNDLTEAVSRLANAPLTKLCETTILPAAVQIAKAGRASDRKAQNLRQVGKIVEACSSADKAETVMCSNLKELLAKALP